MYKYKHPFYSSMEDSHFDGIRNDWVYAFISASALGVMLLAAGYLYIAGSNYFNKGFDPVPDENTIARTNSILQPEQPLISMDTENTQQTVPKPMRTKRIEQVIYVPEKIIVETKVEPLHTQTERTFTAPADYNIRAVDGNDSSVITPPVFLGFDQ